MSEEKKDEAKQQAEVQAPASAPVADAGQTTTQADNKQAAPAKKEKPTNCAACKKSIKNKRNYYRNGSYYCTKRCWKTTKKPAEAPKQEGAAA